MNFAARLATDSVWSLWLPQAFRVVYMSAVLVFTALSLTGSSSGASSNLLSLVGHGNLWLFAPNPARDYLHITACWRSIISREPLCDGGPAFASYRGSLADALLPSSKPTREFRFVEHVSDLSPASRRAIDVFARYWMATTSPSVRGRSCFRVYLHQSALEEHTPRWFQHQIIWKACR